MRDDTLMHACMHHKSDTRFGVCRTTDISAAWRARVNAGATANGKNEAAEGIPRKVCRNNCLLRCGCLFCSHERGHNVCRNNCLLRCGCLFCSHKRGHGSCFFYRHERGTPITKVAASRPTCIHFAACVAARRRGSCQCVQHSWCTYRCSWCSECVAAPADALLL